MPKFLIKWQVEPSAEPSTVEERMKVVYSIIEMTKADLKAGLVKDWGVDLAGQRGYAIIEGLSDAEVASITLKYSHYLNIEVIPVLTIDQTSDAFNKLVAAMKK